MKIMILGSGGREHALATAFLKNPKVEKVFCVPGNGGTALLEGCENRDFDTLADVVHFGVEEQIEFALPGSEETLSRGIVDLFKESGIKAFGPHREAAQLESSKSFAKDFMKTYGVRTASYMEFSSFSKALDYVDKCTCPAVVKADGLAAGKGVFICNTKKEAREALKKIMVDGYFGSAGDKVVVEEYLKGFEVSIHCFFDGRTFIPLLSAMDHKKIGEGETGLNTGGMGVVVPNPHMNEMLWRDFTENILKPTARGIKEKGLEFHGVIFFGVMVKDNKCYLLEYNTRMGDPETQGILALLESDFTSLVSAALEGSLSKFHADGGKGHKLLWKEGAACCIVLASGGYPESYRKGYVIEGLEDVTGAAIHFAGVKEESGHLVTSGGRVLNVVAAGRDLETAVKSAYSKVKKISFPHMVYRKDIGK